MKIAIYIKELLFEHECVIVPGFGAFIASDRDAEIHPVTHKFSPPSKDIAFNASLKKNDGLLKNAIVEREGIPYEEASSQVDVFVQAIDEHLKATGYAEISGVGRFFLNLEGKLEFDPELNENFNEESFGLSDFIFKPIDRNKMQQGNRPPQRLARKSDEDKYLEHDTVKGPSIGKVLTIVVPVVLLLGAGAFFFMNRDSQGGTSESGFMSFLFGKEKAVEAPAVSVPEEPVPAPVEEVAEEPKAATPDTDFNQVAISGKQGRFSVIVGSFRKKKNAEKLLQKVNSSGNHALLVEPDGSTGNYRVSIAEYNEKDAALAGLRNYRQQYQDAWLMFNN